MAVFVKTFLQTGDPYAGVRVAPHSTLFTIQRTHTVAGVITNTSTAHTTEFPYGP